MGRVVSKVDAPFSEANSTAFWSVGGSEFFKVVDVSCCFSRRICKFVRPYLRTVLRPYVRTVLRPYVRTVLRPYVRTVLLHLVSTHCNFARTPVYVYVYAHVCIFYTDDHALVFWSERVLRQRRSGHKYHCSLPSCCCPRLPSPYLQKRSQGCHPGAWYV